MRKPSAREVWQELVDDAGEDAIERAAGVSVAQAEKDLAAAGFDVAAEREKAYDFVLAELARDGRPSGPVAVGRMPAAAEPPASPGVATPTGEDRRPSVRASHGRSSRSVAVWLAAAAAAAVGGVALVTVLNDRFPSGPPAAAPNLSGDPAPVLRLDALDACGAGRFDVCEKKLDEARRLDPAGESDPRVKQARESIARWRLGQDGMER